MSGEFELSKGRENGGQFEGESHGRYVRVLARSWGKQKRKWKLISMSDI